VGSACWEHRDSQAVHAEETQPGGQVGIWSPGWPPGVWPTALLAMIVEAHGAGRSVLFRSANGIQEGSELGCCLLLGAHRPHLGADAAEKKEKERTLA